MKRRVSSNKRSDSAERGFSVFELMIVIGIIAIISTVSVLSLFNRRSQSDLDNVARQMVALLRRAEIASMNQDKGTGWGVHFENPDTLTTTTPPFYILFYGPTYPTTSTLDMYRLPSSVQYLNITPGASTTVFFMQVSGMPSASASISIGLKAAGVLQNSSATISINSLGTIY